MKKFCWLAVLGFAVTVLTGNAARPLPAVKAEGAHLLADGEPLVLRGINWGWWQVEGTRYTEENMKQQAQWGANVLRLAFTYTDVANPDGSWNEERFSTFDEVIRWAEKYGQYVILDMHAVPGGQTPIHYCEEGKNSVWSDSVAQERFLSIWQELAKRYRHTSTVAAYELMNEPSTEEHGTSVLLQLNQRAIEAIRKIDPDKLIVVSGDFWSGYKALTDEIKVDDANVLYTFHYYEGADKNNSRWLGNQGESDEGAKGTRDWQKLSVELAFPELEVNSIRIMLRSTKNQGDAWFDDVELTDDTGKVVGSWSFDQNAEPFSVERERFGTGSYDTTVGHNRPGSLRISGTTDYNGWRSEEISVSPERKYRLSAWVKLNQATGSTYPAVALFGLPFVDEAKVTEDLKAAADFSKKYNVPVWVGEFSVTRDLAGAAYQAEALTMRIRVFEKYGFHWTYWNFRETTGPGTMALQAQKKDGSGDYPVNEMLLEVLKKGWEGTLAQ